MRVLSGIQPSRKLHIGNYFGAIRQHIALQDGNEAVYFIADLHGLTSVRDRASLREYARDVALDYLALGLDPARAVFFRQSDVPEVTELAWVLSTVTPVNRLDTDAYRDKVEKGLFKGLGLFAYPVLMAADILLYDAELVPVGQDQKQHLEITRDVATSFNMAYSKGFDPNTGRGGILRLPEPMIVPEVAVVPGTDGRKMSKSYGNTIDIFGDPKDTKKRIMGIVTDSAGVNDPKDPEKSTIFQLLKLFLGPEAVAEVASRFRARGTGYGHFKTRLLEEVLQHFDAPRKRREDLVRTAAVEDVLADGARRARERALPVLDRVREAVGIGRPR